MLSKKRNGLKCFLFAIGMCGVMYIHKNIMKLLFIVSEMKSGQKNQYNKIF